MKIKQTKKVDWEKELKDFLLYKKAQGVSERTIRDYDKHVNIFFRRHPNAIQQLEVSVMEYMGEDIKPATYNLRRSYLKNFFDYLKEEDLISSNPMEKLSKRKVQDKIIDIPIDTFQQLLTIPNKTTFVGLRDFALMLMMLDNGIRPKEALSLKISDFDLKHNCVTVSAEVAKTGVARTLPLSIDTIRPITKIINLRPDDWDENVPVFSSSTGEKLNADVVSRRFEKYSKTLGTDITPYSLRHCFALYYLRNGGNALTLQKIMGHTTMDMTRKYVALSDTDVKDSHTSFTPIRNILPHKKTNIRKIKK
ncbi:tyrosine-type recombinase/integrase [Clostridium sp. BNL1100]|uniref:tyrosine-type recombinase/integrase n=1 Tax=Clostridium sp. BNL1100 TaxID=755731 RepID=UPI00024A7871|nr:tyrosine-type recombinase/integrase [Clostridium sp. BNL1100]AEY67849.1 site-specific recombinase XerD [Clostridium sp. BNL1100]